MNVRSAVTAIAASLVLGGCGDDGTGLDTADLRGTWVASVYEYTDSANTLNVTDIIQRDGASFTLTVDAEGEASTLLDNGLGNTSSDSGSLNSTATTLTLGGGTFDAQREVGSIGIIGAWRPLRVPISS